MYEGKIVLFGDSVLFGTGASKRKSGCGRILRSLLMNKEVIIKGRNNDTTYQALDRIRKDVLLYNNAIVIILFGNNDCRLNGPDTPVVPLSEYKNNLIKIISMIKSSNKIPVLSNLQPIDSKLFYKSVPEMKKFMININSPREWHKEYSLACEEVAKREMIKLADIHSRLENSDCVISKDGLHPNDLGHQIIAETFYETIKGYV